MSERADGRNAQANPGPCSTGARTDGQTPRDANVASAEAAARTPLLEVSHLSVTLGGRRVVRDVNLTVGEGCWLMLVGPNGAGKSTIVNAISQAVPYKGSVTWRGRDVARMRSRERARKIGVLAQGNNVGYPFTVDEVVHLGRYAHETSPLRHGDDAGAVDDALERCGLMGLRSKSVLELSGGELQRVFLAQALAQDPALLMLDEPTNHLDLLYQRQTFDLLGAWLQEPGRAIVSVVHDLSLARAFGTGVVLLDDGAIVGRGPAGEVLSRETLQAVYGMDVHAWMRGLLRCWEE